MLLVEGKVNLEKFNAVNMAALLANCGITPTAATNQWLTDMGQRLIESMLLSGMIESSAAIGE